MCTGSEIFYFYFSDLPAPSLSLVMPYCFNVEECRSNNNAILVRLNGPDHMGTYLCDKPACREKAHDIHRRARALQR